MITPQQFRNPQVKPKWQLPAGVMESVVAFNCRKYGFPRPVLAMPMWEGAGNRALDYSGHGNNGSLESTTNWVSGGLDFNGTSDYVEVADDNSLDLTGNITVFARIKRDAFGAWVVLVTKGTNTTWASNNYTLALTTNNLLRFKGTFGSFDSSTTVADTKWHHVVGMVDGTNISVFIDGKKASGVQASSPTAVATPLRVGSDNGTADNHTGIIDNVLVFACVLTAAQVKFLYENPYFMYEIPEELYSYVAAAVGEANPQWYYQMLRRR